MTPIPIATTAKFIPPPQPDLPVVTLTLNLTKQQAQDIVLLCEHVAGCPTNSTRKVFDEIQCALRDHGIRSSDHRFLVDVDNMSVTFRSEKDVDLLKKSTAK